MDCSRGWSWTIIADRVGGCSDRLLHSAHYLRARDGPPISGRGRALHVGEARLRKLSSVHHRVDLLDSESPILSGSSLLRSGQRTSRNSRCAAIQRQRRRHRDARADRTRNRCDSKHSWNQSRKMGAESRRTWILDSRDGCNRSRHSDVHKAWKCNADQCA